MQQIFIVKFMYCQIAGIFVRLVLVGGDYELV